MKYVLFVAAMCLSTPAFAEGDAPAGGMDMSKMGPWARKPTNEKQTRKEVAEFFTQEEALMKRGDFEASLARHDFPVYMLTDDLKGVPMGEPWDRDRYVKEMKPFWEGMPKDMKTTHKPTITVLSDSLVVVADDFTTTMGKQKVTGRNTSMLVKRDGKWLWKVMAEAGWGGMASGAAEKKPEPHTEVTPAPAKK